MLGVINYRKMFDKLVFFFFIS